jgi:hypothetical protein
MLTFLIFQKNVDKFLSMGADFPVYSEYNAYLCHALTIELQQIDYERIRK